MANEDVVEEKEAARKRHLDWPALFFGLVIVIGYLVVTSVLIQKGTAASSPQVTELVTTLRDAFMLFMFWLWGSNSASNRKTELLSQAPSIKE